MKVLITGINGFLGSHLAGLLLRNGFEVLGTVRPSSDLHRLKKMKDQIQLLVLNDRISKWQAVDVVIHAATEYGRGAKDSSVFFSNLLWPMEIFESAASSTKCKLFINTDTFFNKASDDFDYLPVYRQSKKFFKDYLRKQTSKVKIVTLTLEHLYGPGDGSDKFIMSMINKLKSGEAEIHLTSGEQRRDFVFVKDAIGAYLTIVQKLNSLNEHYQEFEVGNGYSISIRECVGTIKRLVQNQKTALLWGKIPQRLGEIQNSVSDNSALLALGWKPEYSLVDGLMETIHSVE